MLTIFFVSTYQIGKIVHHFYLSIMFICVAAIVCAFIEENILWTAIFRWHLYLGRSSTHIRDPGRGGIDGSLLWHSASSPLMDDVGSWRHAQSWNRNITIISRQSVYNLSVSWSTKIETPRAALLTCGRHVDCQHRQAESFWKLGKQSWFLFDLLGGGGRSGHGKLCVITHSVKA